MSSQDIVCHINNSLAGGAKKNALDLVAYSESQGMQFELSTTDYWRDKQYWYIKYKKGIIFQGCPQWSFQFMQGFLSSGTLGFYCTKNNL